MSKSSIKQFEEAVKKAEKEVAPHLTSLEKEMSQILEICEKYGVPMDLPISKLGNTYIPRDIKVKHPNLTDDEISDISGAYAEGYNYSGWVHSAVCY